MKMVDKNRIRLMFNAILVNGKPDSPNRASKHRKTPKHLNDDASGWNSLRNYFSKTLIYDRKMIKFELSDISAMENVSKMSLVRGGS